MIRSIYYIENIVNNKVYIGSSIDTYKRWADHTNKLRNNKHANRYIQNAWNKHGEKNFVFGIIECVSKFIKLVDREEFWVNKTFSNEPAFGYNLRKVVESNLGLKASPETRAKISAFQRNKIVSEETRARMRIAQKGKFVSEETKKKLSAFNIGKKLSEETKSKIGNFQRTRIFSQETRFKIGQANRNADRWPHGSKCDCNNCVELRRKYDREYYHATNRP